MTARDGLGRIPLKPDHIIDPKSTQVDLNRNLAVTSLYNRITVWIEQAASRRDDGAVPIEY